MRSRMSAERSITASSRSISTVSPETVGGQRAGELVLDDRERPRLVVAHGDKPMAGQDEGNGRRFRRAVSDWHISVAVM